MLDDNDIKKLKEVFITKEDFRQTFVTKEEFEGFMEVASTKSDLEKLATKEELNDAIVGLEKRLEKRFDKIDEKLDAAKSLEHRVGYIENTLNIQPLKG